MSDAYDAGPRIVGEAEAREADERRRTLLEGLPPNVRSSFRGSKLHTGALSPGCEACGRGRWSCLFVHVRCDATCFFCPSRSDAWPSASVSYAEGVPFDDPERYAAYVGALGFTGVSFSGGEPMLQMARVLAWLRALRQAHGAGLRIWLYTNGRLATDEKLAALRDAGLDELRFDIAAVDYDLEAVARAVGVIDTVTIEIPAVPEDLERVRGLLPEMQRIGVGHLHLHQLMVIGTNGPALAERGYAVTGGATPGVVTSELAALELLRHAAETGLELPVHYCSRAFKGRWHVRAATRRAAEAVLCQHEGLTDAGLIREAWVEGPLAELERLAADLSAAARCHVSPVPPRALLHASLLAEATRRGLAVRVAYYRATLGPAEALGVAGAYGELRDPSLASDPTLRVLVQPACAPIVLEASDARDLEAIYERGIEVGGRSAIAALEPWERLEAGLPDYR